jgi:hypothetical protein
MDMEEDENEPTFYAEKFYDVLNDKLSFYGKSMENVQVLIGDNCSVNKRLADICEKPMVSCYSHRLNLAVNKYLQPREGLLRQVEDIMVRLTTLKKASKLRQKTDLNPVLRNKTRWSSTHDMVERYLNLYEFLVEEMISGFD